MTVERDPKFNQEFRLPNDEILFLHEDYKGQYYAHSIQSIYQDNEDKNQVMSEEWKNVDCEKFEKRQDYINTDTRERYSVVETFVTAENLNWQEIGLTSQYDGDFACNCEYKTKIELVLMAEEFKRRLFIEWDGNYSFGDYMANLEDHLHDELHEKYEKHNIKIIEDSYYQIDFYSDRGEYTHLDIEKDDLLSLVVSAKVINYDYKIVK